MKNLCVYDQDTKISQEEGRKLGLTFPDAYLHGSSMSLLARARKKRLHEAVCRLPFCHTTEAEALGGRVTYGDQVAGPRGGAYRWHSMRELSGLSQMDFTSGRLHETLCACRMLSEAGETVALEVSGAFTVLGVLIEGEEIFRALRRDRKLSKQILWKIGNELLRYMEKAKECGVRLIRYADPVSGGNILGPKLAAQVMKDFTYDFLKQAEELANREMLICLCPKITRTLTDLGMARICEIPMEKPMAYDEACIEMIGRIGFAGTVCMHGLRAPSDAVFPGVALVEQNPDDRLPVKEGRIG